MHVEKWKDVPNRFAEGSVITIEGDTSHFFVNGMQKQGGRNSWNKLFQDSSRRNKNKISCE